MLKTIVLSVSGVLFIILAVYDGIKKSKTNGR